MQSYLGKDERKTPHGELEKGDQLIRSTNGRIYEQRVLGGEVAGVTGGTTGTDMDCVRLPAASEPFATSSRRPAPSPFPSAGWLATVECAPCGRRLAVSPSLPSSDGSGTRSWSDGPWVAFAGGALRVASSTRRMTAGTWLRARTSGSAGTSDGPFSRRLKEIIGQGMLQKGKKHVVVTLSLSLYSLYSLLVQKKMKINWPNNSP